MPMFVLTCLSCLLVAAHLVPVALAKIERVAHDLDCVQFYDNGSYAENSGATVEIGGGAAKAQWLLDAKRCVTEGAIYTIVSLGVQSLTDADKAQLSTYWSATAGLPDMAVLGRPVGVCSPGPPLCQPLDALDLGLHHLVKHRLRVDAATWNPGLPEASSVMARLHTLAAVDSVASRGAYPELPEAERQLLEERYMTIAPRIARQQKDNLTFVSPMPSTALVPEALPKQVVHDYLANLDPEGHSVVAVVSGSTFDWRCHLLNWAVSVYKYGLPGARLVAVCLDSLSFEFCTQLSTVPIACVDGTQWGEQLLAQARTTSRNETELWRDFYIAVTWGKLELFRTSTIHGFDLV
eukprot:TRINITY_DN25617_c0_g1_i2.p1 TRINITY_DN25617_c0_g1~~TRINITY_DN25617_c0_g1_i2.p1  ORF type:complete len:404 (+),score=23.98 TRINITY_DN25617_c0_g1_i2:161-1213(+)